jgi:hypothetical protein
MFQEPALAKAGIEPMKEVARMIRKHFDCIVAWTQTRQTNGFAEAVNGLFQAAKRKARRLYTFPDDADRFLPHRLQTRLLPAQPSCGITHSNFKRAIFGRRAATE